MSTARSQLMHKTRWTLLPLTVALLAACGGGGSGAPDNSSPPNGAHGTSTPAQPGNGSAQGSALPPARQPNPALVPVRPTPMPGFTTAPSQNTGTSRENPQAGSGHRSGAGTGNQSAQPTVPGSNTETAAGAAGGAAADAAPPAAMGASSIASGAAGESAAPAGSPAETGVTAPGTGTARTETGSAASSGTDAADGSAGRTTGADTPGNAAGSATGPDTSGNAAGSAAGPDTPGSAAGGAAGPDTPGNAATGATGADAGNGAAAADADTRNGSESQADANAGGASASSSDAGTAAGTATGSEAPDSPPGNGQATGHSTPGHTSQQPDYGTAPLPRHSDYLSDPHCKVNYRPGPLAAPTVGADPLFGQQWYLHNRGTTRGSQAGEDLNLINTWAAGKGEGIRVAIIDDAVDVLHEDLLPNMVAGGSYNFRHYRRGTPYPVPCSPHESHGTAVAGLIAGRDNNGIGITGVAPRANLVGLNALATGEDADILSALAYDNNSNHIYNNSWGSPDDGHFHSLIGQTGLKTTIQSGLESGRNGKGSIYVFAAGNGGCLTDATDPNETTCQGTELSTNDGHVTQLGTIAICATESSGKRAFYSEPGANLLVCAPSAAHDGMQSAVITTDIQNTYEENFGGTSAATPMASGVIALMLQANPELSWRDVRLVLARSARKVDPASPGWTRFDGLNFNHEYGFGVIDADAAVRLARTWHSVGNSSSLKQCGPYQGSVQQFIPKAPVTAAQQSDSPDYNRRATGGLSHHINIPADCDIRHIEHVQVNIRTSGQNPYQPHPDAGDLHLTLTSPAGQTSTLNTPHPCYRTNSQGVNQETACTGLNNFDVGLTRHMAEPAIAGGNPAWTLEATDQRGDRRGKLDSWSLTLYGH